MQPVERLLHGGVALDVEVRERLAVAGQELLQCQRTAREGRPDQDDVPASLRDERGAPQHERPQEDLAQLGVGLDERAQAGRGKLENARRSPGAPARHHRPAREEIDVAGEGALLAHGHDVVRAQQDLDGAAQDHEQRPIAVSRRPQAVAVGEVALARQRGDAFDLARGQRRKRLVFGGGERIGHVLVLSAWMRCVCASIHDERLSVHGHDAAP